MLQVFFFFLIQYSLPQAKDCRQQLEQQQVSTSPTKGLTDNKNTSKTVRLTAGCCGSRYVVAFFLYNEPNNKFLALNKN